MWNRKQIKEALGRFRTNLSAALAEGDLKKIATWADAVRSGEELLERKYQGRKGYPRSSDHMARMRAARTSRRS